MRALALIYNYRVSGILESLIGFDSKPEKESESRKDSRNASVGRPAGRPTLVLGRLAPTESSAFQSVYRAVDRSLAVHVVHNGRPDGRPALSTG